MKAIHAYDFIFIFVNMAANGSKDFNMLLLLQFAAKGFQTGPQSSYQWCSQIYVGDFEILSVRFLTICFRKSQMHHCTL